MKDLILKKKLRKKYKKLIICTKTDKQDRASYIEIRFEMILAFEKYQNVFFS
ncbi:hypothetical protein LEP1GSC053_3482 [Leptospira interrogans serovar Muenchen str. Brem 129]|nr:hypothetical protein LEP1GSC053_3482 [Leptospira interrogans serovar Muenchen str. Brem 129]